MRSISEIRKAIQEETMGNTEYKNNVAKRYYPSYFVLCDDDPLVFAIFFFEVSIDTSRSTGSVITLHRPAYYEIYDIESGGKLESRTCTGNDEFSTAAIELSEVVDSINSGDGETANDTLQKIREAILAGVPFEGLLREYENYLKQVCACQTPFLHRFYYELSLFHSELKKNLYIPKEIKDRIQGKAEKEPETKKKEEKMRRRDVDPKKNAFEERQIRGPKEHKGTGFNYRKVKPQEVEKTGSNENPIPRWQKDAEQEREQLAKAKSVEAHQAKERVKDEAPKGTERKAAASIESAVQAAELPPEEKTKDDAPFVPERAKEEPKKEELKKEEPKEEPPKENEFEPVSEADDEYSWEDDLEEPDYAYDEDIPDTAFVNSEGDKEGEERKEHPSIKEQEETAKGTQQEEGKSSDGEAPSSDDVKDHQETAEKEAAEPLNAKEETAAYTEDKIPTGGNFETGEQIEEKEQTAPKENSSDKAIPKEEEHEEKAETNRMPDKDENIDAPNKSEVENQADENASDSHKKEEAKGSSEEKKETPVPEGEKEQNHGSIQPVKAAPKEQDDDLSSTTLLPDKKDATHQHREGMSDGKHTGPYLPRDIFWNPKEDLSRLPDKYFLIAKRIASKIKFLECEEKMIRIEYPVCCYERHIPNGCDPWAAMQLRVLNTNLPKRHYRIQPKGTIYLKCSADNGDCVFFSCPYVIAAYIKYLEDTNKEELDRQRRIYHENKNRIDEEELPLIKLDLSGIQASSFAVMKAREYIDKGLFSMNARNGQSDIVSATVVTDKWGNLVTIGEEEPEIQFLTSYFIETKKIEEAVIAGSQLRLVDGKICPEDIALLIYVDLAVQNGTFDRLVHHLMEREKQPSIVTTTIDGNGNISQTDNRKEEVSTDTSFGQPKDAAKGKTLLGRFFQR